MLSDELHTVIDEDESDFAELGFLFRMQKRVVQGVAQLLQDRQENSAYLECEEEPSHSVWQEKNNGNNNGNNNTNL